MENKPANQDVLKTYFPEIKLGFLLVLFLLLLLYGLPFMVSTSVATVKDYANHRRDEKAAVQWQKDSVRIEKRFSLYQKKVEKVKLIVSKERQLALFYGILNESATAATVRFNSVKPLPETETNTDLTAPFEISISGDYHSFGRFINNLEKNGGLVKISSMAIKPSGLKLNADINLEFLVMK